MDMLFWVGDYFEKEDDVLVNFVKDKFQFKRKLVFLLESFINLVKKVKYDSINVNLVQEEFDRRIIRRLKNNIAFKYVRVNRKYKELELF